jgi:hypothetical protein
MPPNSESNSVKPVGTLFKRLNLFERLVEKIPERYGLIADPLLRHLEKPLLGVVQDLHRRLGLVVGRLHDLAAALDQIAEHRLVADDSCVVLAVGRRGNRLRQIDQILPTADLVEQSATPQLILQHDDVDRLVLVVEVDQHLVEQAVVRSIEARGLIARNDLHDLADGVPVEQKRPKQACLRFQILRRKPAGRDGISRPCGRRRTVGLLEC